MPVRAKSVYLFECFDSAGRLKWREEIENIVVTVGLNELLDKTFKASSYTATWFVGLKDTGTPDAADTMGSHASWAEIVPYSDATRPALTLGTPSAGSVDNSASKASFAINATDEVFGGFVANNSTKSGTSGVLYGVADFAASRNVESGDTLNVTVTLSVTAA
jgi:hypothetical protein